MRIKIEWKQKVKRDGDMAKWMENTLESLNNIHPNWWNSKTETFNIFLWLAPEKGLTEETGMKYHA